MPNGEGHNDVIGDPAQASESNLQWNIIVCYSVIIVQMLKYACVSHCTFKYIYFLMHRFTRRTRGASLSPTKLMIPIDLCCKA